MKHILLIITAILALCISCKGNGAASVSNDIRHDSIAETRQYPLEDSINENKHDQIKGRVIEDTVIGHWAIKALTDSNDVIVINHDWSYRDQSVFLTLSYDNRAIYAEKEIRTKDLVGNDGKYLMGCNGVFLASDSAIYLSFGCYIPDSDDGWNMLYQILPDGKSNIIVIQEYMGVDGFDAVAYFMALYLNERAAGASDGDLKRIFDDYCTEDIAEKLATGTIQIIADDTDFQYADKTLRIDPLDELVGPPLEKYSFKVKFKPKPNDENITDEIFFEVDGSSNKISNIDSGYRKVV